MKLIFFVFFFFLSSLFSFSGNINIDSLKKCIAFAKADSSKARMHNELGDFYKIPNPDSAIYLYRKAMEIIEENTSLSMMAASRFIYVRAILSLSWIYCEKKSLYDSSVVLSNKALTILTELEKSENPEIKKKSQKEISTCYNNIGKVYAEQGAYDNALEYYKKSLKSIEFLNDLKGMRACYFNMGNMYYYKGNFDLAISNYQKALDIDEKLKNKSGVSACYNNIGNVHLSQNSYDKAIEYYSKSLAMDTELGDKRGMSFCYGNIGIVYNSKSDYKKALEFAHKQLEINEQQKDLKGISNCYTNIGNTYFNMGECGKAIVYLEKSMKIVESLNDKYSEILILVNIAELKIVMGDSARKVNKNHEFYYRESVQFGLKAYKLSREIKSMPMENGAAWVLYKAYKLMNQTSDALEYAERFIASKDSMFRQEKTDAITEMETRYQTEKKQQEIEKQQLLIGKKDADLKQEQATSSRQKIVIGFVICGLLFVIIILFVLYRMFVHKKKTNEIITIKNKDLEQANEEIKAQRDEIEAQRDIVVLQKNEIQDIHSELTSSIVYARRIQQAVLPMSEYISDFLSEYFILFKPKDIVSGDFFWITKLNKWNLFCVADCTGHGVPGAFMSMLGISLLNEIVRQDNVIQASHVLDQMRKRVMESLKQKGVSGEQQDGMDMAFCALNTETMELHFAGANNPVWVIRTLSSDTDRSRSAEMTELVEIKGDKMPIGIYERMQTFANQIIQVQHGDTIYLMSDGFEDQFGGTEYKKFYSKNLKKLIFNNCQKPMLQQKEILESTLSEWIGNGEQIDDITVLGIKI